MGSRPPSQAKDPRTIVDQITKQRGKRSERRRTKGKGRARPRRHTVRATTPAEARTMAHSYTLDESVPDGTQSERPRPPRHAHPCHTKLLMAAAPSHDYSIVTYFFAKSSPRAYTPKNSVGGARRAGDREGIKGGGNKLVGECHQTAY